jgi:hypothetical protein
MSKIRILAIPSDQHGVGKFRILDPYKYIAENHSDEIHVDIAFNVENNDNVVTITETEEVETLGDKFDPTINISDELAPVKEEAVREVVTKKVEMPRTPGQYIIKDPITGGGNIKTKGK